MRNQIKKILKLLFPIIWLKKVFIVYNKIKIRTIDKLFFPELEIENKLFIVKREERVYDALNINESLLPEKIRQRLKLWHNWSQDEYLLVLNQRCVIEPANGWALAGDKLVYPSLGFSRADYLRKPNFIKFHFSKKKEKHYPKVISLRDTGEENYFHFYNDILAKLFFLDDHKIPAEIPVLISKNLFDKSYFQFYLANSTFLQKRTWIVQDDEYISTDTAIFCKPLTHTKKYLERIVSSLTIPHSPTSATRKIFLYRSPMRLRYISNFPEVINLCGKYGIDIIDTDELNVSKQIEYFSTASHIVGIHGAGLVNMIYGKNTVKKIIEIFPPWNYVPFHYIMLAKIYGFEYDAVLGKKGNESSSGGFIVDISELDETLKNDMTLAKASRIEDGTIVENTNL